MLPMMYAVLMYALSVKGVELQEARQDLARSPSSISYDVEWSSSDKKRGVHVLTVTVNDCKTYFNVSSDVLKVLPEKDELIRKVASIAVSRYYSGCVGQAVHDIM